MLGMFDWLRVLASRIRGLLTRQRLDEDFQQELGAHLALLTEENLRPRYEAQGSSSCRPRTPWRGYPTSRDPS